MTTVTSRLSYSQLKNYYTKLTPLLKDARNTAYFMLILSLFSLSFFGSFAIRPALKTIIELNRKIEDAQEVNRKLGQKIKNLSTLQAEYKRIEGDLPIIYTALPNQIQAPTLLLKLRTLATVHNLVITNLQVTKSPLSEDFGKQDLIGSPFILTAEGEYQSINNFLNALSVLDRIVTLDEVQISSTTAVTSGDKLTVKLSGRFYTLFD